MKINLHGQQIDILPERAFFWPAEKILGLSDIHFGKALSLQLSGVPVPAADNEDLLKLAHLILKYEPLRVFILGDFVHAKNSWTQDLYNTLMTFFDEFPDVEFHLVIGNHEKGSLKFVEELPLILHYEDVHIGALTFSHGHQVSKAEYTIHGHIHPVVQIREGSTRLRLPCFVVGPVRMVIPSFGSLTGGYEIEREPLDKIFALTGKTIFEVPSPTVNAKTLDK